MDDSEFEKKAFVAEPETTIADYRARRLTDQSQIGPIPPRIPPNTPPVEPNKDIMKDNVTLKDYQLTGFRWMMYRETVPERPAKIYAGFLFDNPGLGKTIQTIATIVSNPVPATLIIAPPSLVSVWKDQFTAHTKNDKVGNRGSDFLLYSVQDSDDNVKWYRDINQKLVIIQQELSKGTKVPPIVVIIGNSDVKSPRNKNIKYFHQNPFKWNRLIFDEAHNYKNPKSKGFEITLRIPRVFTWCLTGTPITNAKDELRVMLQLSHVIQTENDMTNLISAFTGRQSVIGNAINEEGMRTILQYVAMRRLTAFPGLPPNLFEYVVYLQPTDEEKQLLEMLKNKIRQMRTDIVDFQKRVQALSSGQNGLAIILKLRRTCVLPSLIVEDFLQGARKEDLKEDNVFNIMKGIEARQEPLIQNRQDDEDKDRVQKLLESFREKCSKVVAVIKITRETLQSSNTRKIVITSEWTSILDKFLLVLKKEFPTVGIVEINGETPPANRVNIVEDFQTNPEIRICLLSTKAGGEGINLNAADTMIFLDRWWNAYYTIQTSKRIDRVSKRQNVYIYHLHLQNTIEDDIFKISVTKGFHMELLDDDGETNQESQVRQQLIANILNPNLNQPFQPAVPQKRPLQLSSQVSSQPIKIPRLDPNAQNLPSSQPAVPLPQLPTTDRTKLPTIRAQPSVPRVQQPIIDLEQSDLPWSQQPPLPQLQTTELTKLPTIRAQPSVSRVQQQPLQQSNLPWSQQPPLPQLQTTERTRLPTIRAQPPVSSMTPSIVDLEQSNLPWSQQPPLPQLQTTERTRLPTIRAQPQQPAAPLIQQISSKQMQDLLQQMQNLSSRQPDLVHDLQYQGLLQMLMTQNQLSPSLVEKIQKIISILSKNPPVQHPSVPPVRQQQTLSRLPIIRAQPAQPAIPPVPPVRQQQTLSRLPIIRAQPAQPAIPPVPPVRQQQPPPQPYQGPVLHMPNFSVPNPARNEKLVSALDIMKAKGL